jgi:hypothetical protein
MKDKSLLLIERMEKSKKPSISVVNTFKVRTGKVLGCIRKMGSRDSKFVIGTPTAVAGIRGTVFGIYVQGDSTELDVLKGEVGIQGDSGEEVMVGEKMTTTVTKGDSARHPVAMTAAKIAFMTLWAGQHGRSHRHRLVCIHRGHRHRGHSSGGRHRGPDHRRRRKRRN